jgi:hypothetical protein
MNLQDVQRQATEYQKQFQAAGMSGVLYILSCPGEGWLKLQLKDMPAPLMAQLIQGFQQTLAMGGSALNLVVKVKTREGGNQ